MAKLFARLLLCLLSLLVVSKSAQAQQIFTDVFARTLYFTNTSTGARIGSGTAVPTASWPNGSIYLRVTTGTSTLYCRQDSAWVVCGSGSGSGFADGSSGSPSIFFTSQTTTGFYRPSSGNIGITANLLPSASLSKSLGSSSLLFADAYFSRISLGDNAAGTFTSPTRNLYASKAFTGVSSGTNYTLGTFSLSVSASGSYSGTVRGFQSDAIAAGIQNFTGEVDGLVGSVNNTTTGTVTQENAAVLAISRSGGLSTTSRGLRIDRSYTGAFSGTDTFGAYIDTPSYSGGYTFTNNYGLFIQDQSVSGCTVCVDLHLAGSNSSGWRWNADGHASATINQVSATTLSGTAGLDITRNYTGGAGQTQSTFAGYFWNMSNPSADVTDTTKLTYGAYGAGGAEGTKRTPGAIGVYCNGYISATATTPTFDPVTGAGAIAGCVGDGNNYKSSGTQAKVFGLWAWGGNGSGATTTDFYRMYVSPLYEVSGTITNHVGLQIDDQTTLAAGASGSISNITNNYAIRVGSANTGSANQGIMANGAPFDAVQAVTIADNGSGTNATSTVTPTAGQVELTCSDTQGCDITLGETGIIWGQRVTFICMSTSVNNFADTSAVSEAAGTFACGQYDSISFRYAEANGTTGRWVETSRSNN